MKSFNRQATALVLAVVLLLTGVLSTTEARAAQNILASEQIKVQKGVNIYFNEYPYVPTDVNDKEVDTFIYGGTTYLPVRAVSKMFGASISWDGETNSVYVGRPQGLAINDCGFRNDREMSEVTLRVYTGVSIYVENKNGQYERLVPKDVNGKEVPVFINNGTTYLPARAIANVFETNIEWDGANSRVYIGERIITREDFKRVMEADLDLFDQWYQMLYDAEDVIPQISYIAYLVKEKSSGKDHEKMVEKDNEILKLYNDVKKYISMRPDYGDNLKDDYFDVLSDEGIDLRLYYGNNYKIVKSHLWHISQDCSPEALNKYIDDIEDMAQKVGVDISQRIEKIRACEYLSK